MAITVDNLTQKCHLTHTLGDQTAHFAHYFVNRAAALDAAPKGNDAECAGVATAVDHRHMSSHRGLAVDSQVSNGLAGAGWLYVVLHRVAMGDLLHFYRGGFDRNLILLQIGDQRCRLAGRHEHVYMRKTSAQLRAGLDADHAAHQRQSTVRPVPLPRLEVAGLSDALVFRALPHYAGVEYNDIGIVHCLGRSITDPLQFRGHMVGVGNIHLAADGPNVIGASVSACRQSGLDRVTQRDAPLIQDNCIRIRFWFAGRCQFKDFGIGIGIALRHGHPFAGQLRRQTFASRSIDRLTSASNSRHQHFILARIDQLVKNWGQPGGMRENSEASPAAPIISR